MTAGRGKRGLVQRRRHPFHVIGLTGSIGMGKTTAANMFRRQGLPVFDSDAAVHRLFRPGGAAVAPVLARFPGCGAEDGGIDRKTLGSLVFGKPEELAALERIVHPLVNLARQHFLQRCGRRRVRAVVLDVPLLFETRGDRRTDSVWVVSAPAFLQAQRVLARPGMTGERLKHIRAQQTPDAEKRRRARIILPTGLGRRTTLRALLAGFRLTGLRQGNR